MFHSPELRLTIKICSPILSHISGLPRRHGSLNSWQGEDAAAHFYHLMPPILEMPYRMGPPVDSVNRTALFQWLNFMGYGRYTYSIYGLSTNKHHWGAHPVEILQFPEHPLGDQKQLVQQRTTTANYRVDREGKDDHVYGCKWHNCLIFLGFYHLLMI